MTRERDLIELERAGWEALASDGGAARAHYSGVLADDVVFLLPGGLVIDDREAVLESMSGQPWESYELAGERLVALGADAASVVYEAEAVRGGEPYRAVIASTYVRSADGWRLSIHQQTPS